ncbi:MAG: UDP-glucuronic acid decarboxylase family protein [Candidatus Andersenbacteria bacterium]
MTPPSARRALVTGAAGFLGSHLVDALLAQGSEVVGLDNFYSGRRENLAHLRSSSAFTLLEHDVRAPLPAAVGAADVIYHLACPASPPVYQRDPLFTLETNVTGTRNVLDYATQQRARVVFTSTSEVYGSPLVHPQPETYWGNVNPIGPRSVYDEGKRVAETLCLVFNQRGVDVRIARVFNTYGPRMRLDDGRFVTTFIAQALRGQPLTVFGDGSQTRSLCYVDDLITGLLALGESGELPFGPINLGSTDEHPVRAIAEMILTRTGSRAALGSAPLPQDDPPQRRPDLTLAARLLRWAPTTDLATGLDRTIEYARGELALQSRTN